MVSWRVVWTLLLFCTKVAAVWPDSGPHIFVDFSGLAKVEKLNIVQHEPVKTYEMAVVPDKPWETLISSYTSIVQVSDDDLRIYYDTFGPQGRFLCLARSVDRGQTWQKPDVHLVPFNGSTANNILLGIEGKQSLEPGTVFLDENPDCPLAEKFKAVIDTGGSTMFASEDGIKFNKISPPLLTGSDTADVVFYDHRVGNGSYVYYGRSHRKGGQSVSCASFSDNPKAQEPARSINHFIIGSNVTNWPVHSADSPDTTIFNTDAFDPPCMDLYTSVATPLHDAYFFFPQMFDHFGPASENDGMLESRMAVSRDGKSLSYLSRRAWNTRGIGQLRPNETNIFKGAFDAGSTAVARGMFHVGEETWLYGMGMQYTHAGYVGYKMPGGPVLSGAQKLKLRRNGLTSLSTVPGNISAIGVMETVELQRPRCGDAENSFFLELNFHASIGLGVMVELLNNAGNVVASSDAITGNYVAKAVQWKEHASSTAGIDLSSHWPAGVSRSLRISMAEADLYTIELRCRSKAVVSGIFV